MFQAIEQLKKHDDIAQPNLEGLKTKRVFAPITRREFIVSLMFQVILCLKNKLTVSFLGY